jgi:hypothetical protein
MAALLATIPSHQHVVVADTLETKTSAMEISSEYSHTTIFSSVVSVIRSPRRTRWREAIARMAPSNVKHSILDPSVKWMVYLTSPVKQAPCPNLSPANPPALGRNSSREMKNQPVLGHAMI